MKLSDKIARASDNQSRTLKFCVLLYDRYIHKPHHTVKVPIVRWSCYVNLLCLGPILDMVTINLLYKVNGL